MGTPSYTIHKNKFYKIKDLNVKKRISSGLFNKDDFLKQGTKP